MLLFALVRVASLSITQVNPAIELLSFVKKTWSPSEYNYPNFHKEMTAAIYCLKFWRHYLLGRPFILYTDSSPLSQWKQMKNPQGRLANLSSTFTNTTL